jgi:hypothetical protein
MIMEVGVCLFTIMYFPVVGKASVYKKHFYFSLVFRLSHQLVSNLAEDSLLVLLGMGSVNGRIRTGGHLFVRRIVWIPTLFFFLVT